MALAVAQGIWGSQPLQYSNLFDSRLINLQCNLELEFSHPSGSNIVQGGSHCHHHSPLHIFLKAAANLVGCFRKISKVDKMDRARASKEVEGQV